MTSTKTNIALPEEVEKALKALTDACGDAFAFKQVHGFTYQGPNLVAPLRRAIKRLELLAEIRGLNSAHDSWLKRELTKSLRAQADALKEKSDGKS